MDEEGHLSERQLNLSLKSRSRKKCREELLRSEETKLSEERGKATREGEPERGLECLSHRLFLPLWVH